MQDQFPISFTMRPQKQPPVVGSARLLLLGKSLPRASRVGVDFGTLGGDLHMLIPSTGLLWVPELAKKYPRSRTAKQAGERILWQSLFVGCGVWAPRTCLLLGEQGREREEAAPCSPSPNVVLCRSFALAPSQLFWSQLSGLFLLWLATQELIHIKCFKNYSNNQHPGLFSSTLEQMQPRRTPLFDPLSQQLLSCLLHDPSYTMLPPCPCSRAFGDRESEPSERRWDLKPPSPSCGVSAQTTKPG